MSEMNQAGPFSPSLLSGYPRADSHEWGERLEAKLNRCFADLSARVTTLEHMHNPSVPSHAPLNRLEAGFAELSARLTAIEQERTVCKQPPLTAEQINAAAKVARGDLKPAPLVLIRERRGAAAVLTDEATDAAMAAYFKIAPLYDAVRAAAQAALDVLQRGVD